jgi:hypothetical protein
MKGLAITSMVLGIVGIVFTLTICGAVVGLPMAAVGVVLGGVSLVKYKTAESQEGKGMALAGLVLCIAAIVVFLIMTAVCATSSTEFIDALENYNP